MKSSGSTLAFTRERNDALLALYRQYIAQVSFISLQDVVRKIVDSPSPRFWVSEERAAAVISALLRGKPVLDAMRPSKREMFREIFSRVVALKNRQPHRPLNSIICEVIYSPAPKFYMEPASVRQRLFKIRNGWYNRNHGKSNH